MNENTNEIVEVNTEVPVSVETVQQTYISPFTDRENFQTLFDMAKMFAQSTMVPKTYQGNPMNCAIAIDMANRQGLSPFFTMQNLWVVQGTPTWSGQACMALIKNSGEYKSIKPIYVGKEGTDDWGCFIKAVEVETGEEVQGTTVTMKMAKDEGWYGKSGSKWKTMPKQMLAYRAAAFFARVFLPNALMGAKVEGEPEDIARPDKQEKRMAPNPLEETVKPEEVTPETVINEVVEEIPEFLK